ncbi:hypothetical protein [Spirosoma fluminis]
MLIQYPNIAKRNRFAYEPMGLSTNDIYSSLNGSFPRRLTLIVNYLPYNSEWLLASYFASGQEVAFLPLMQ